MPEAMSVYVGRLPIYAYEQVAIAAIMKHGQVKIAARGTLISKAILVAHRLVTRYDGVHIVDEETRIERLPDDGRTRESFSRHIGKMEGFVNELQEEKRPRSGMRDVSVYQARLIYQKEQDLNISKKEPNQTT
jgi:DNA-binding protein